MHLQVNNLTVLYDTAMVLNGVTVEVAEGELVSLVGPNGAGKSTLLRALAGLVKWERDTLKGTRLGRITLEGSVLYKGEEMLGKAPHAIARKGLVLCPERGKPFKEMTVLENLAIGAYMCKDKGELKRRFDRVYDLFPVLKSRQHQTSGTLSGGERSMLAIGRSLMSKTDLILIDEPSVGLAPKVKDALFDRIRDVHGMGITIFMVEQDVSFAFDLSNRNYVLSRGKVIAEGDGNTLLNDETLRKTYLGL